ncbi:hypothetical protein KAW65_02000 [candidate division WOR-3 bacterium]|nr:hypothetical protein [candidate division WOR-3 bacterium]
MNLWENRPKENYNVRRKRVRETLIGWGILEKLARKIINPPHKLGDIEKIIHDTEKRKPKEPDKYFLKGLNYYRGTHKKSPIYRSLTTNEKKVK